MNVPTMAEMLSQGKEPEGLFWVGAAGSYDDRAKKSQELLLSYYIKQMLILLF